MKLRKKYCLILFVGVMMSISSLLFLNSESKNSASRTLPKIEQEELKHSVPSVDPAKLVKYMFETLLKLVPKSAV